MIDNEIEYGMVINRKYVMAHTNNVVLNKPFSNPNNSNLDFLIGLGIGQNDPVIVP